MSSFIEKNQKNIERLVYIISIVMPLSTLTQVIEIFTTKNVSWISLLMYCIYVVLQIPIFLYTVSIKAKPLIINTCLWIFVYILVIIGILIYR